MGEMRRHITADTNPMAAAICRHIRNMLITRRTTEIWIEADRHFENMKITYGQENVTMVIKEFFPELINVVEQGLGY